MNQIIQEVIYKYIGSADELLNLAALYGDASYRTYFRAGLKSGRSLIVMKLPDGRASVSEEITNYKGPKDELPYINISNYFRRVGIPVPEIYYYDKERSALIIEDLGEKLFFNCVDGTSEAEVFGWYKKAIDLLCKIQEISSKDDNCIVYKRSFDDALLNWEFDHFMEYGIEARLGVSPDEKIKERFIEITRAISKEISEIKYGFTHRDYQSKNLMVKDSKIFVIDFQDALLGPPSYDLVALTRDSYIDLTDDLRNDLIDHYCGLRSKNRAAFQREYDLVTIQRKLKDAGRFVYIEKVKGNPNYLKHIPRSLQYVKQALLRQVDHKELLEILEPYVPEWKNG